MPVSGPPVPPKKKMPFKIITDLSNISQHGQWCSFMFINATTLIHNIMHSLLIPCEGHNYQKPLPVSYINPLQAIPNTPQALTKEHLIKV